MIVSLCPKPSTLPAIDDSHQGTKKDRIQNQELVYGIDERQDYVGVAIK